MRSLATALLIIAVIWGGCYVWSQRGNDETAVATETPSPTFFRGEGGQDIENESVPFDQDMESPVPTPTPIVIFRTVTPQPTPTPVLAFRAVNSLNGSGQFGVALISADVNGNAKVWFNVNGSPAGVLQPAFIYLGTNCMTADVLGFRLEPLFDGSSTTTLNIKASNLLAGNYVIVIHKSADEMETRFACAQI